MKCHHRNDLDCVYTACSYIPVLGLWCSNHSLLVLGREKPRTLLQSVNKERDGIGLEVLCVANFVKIL
ncbi:hypothetical protein LB504_005590 [Fusarium proliferatum]|nr:hypothetical protein LB504_005590 [Fusarium proliferatum]